MRYGFLILSTAVVCLALASPRTLQASCGQAFCPIETSTTIERYPHGGELQMNLTYEYIDMDRPYIGTSKAEVGEIPRPHDEISTRNNTYKLALDYGLTPRLSIGALFPFLDRLHRHLAHEEEEVVGSPEGTEIVDIPERWRYQAFGDMQVAARYLLLQPETPLQPAFSLLVGMKLPTGRTGVDNDAGEKAELTLQPGNGSWDGIVGLTYVQNFTAWTLQRQASLLPVFATVLGRFSIGKGKFGYRPGGEMFLNVGVAYPLLRQLDFLAQVNFYYRDRDDVGHAPGVEQADTGKETIFLSPGFRYHITEKIAVYSFMQFAVYRRVNGIQLTSDWNFTSGLSYRFNLFPNT